MRQYTTIFDTLIEIGRIKSINKGWLPEIEKYEKHILESAFRKNEEKAKQEMNHGINLLKEEVNKAKKSLFQDDIVFSDVELMEDTVEYCLNIFDEVVFAKIGIDEEAKKLENLKNIFNVASQSIDKIFEGLFDWFYEEFEPYRLVLYNELRREYVRKIPEDLKHFFPWYNLYIEEDENVFLKLALAGVGKQGKVKITPEFALAYEAIKRDKVLKAYVLQEYKDFKLFYDVIEENPYLILFHEICEIGDFIELPEVIEQKGFFYVVDKTFNRLKERIRPIDALVLAVCCGPMEDERRIEWLKGLLDLPEQILKEGKHAREIAQFKETKRGVEHFIEKLFDVWVKECEKTAKELELEKKEETYYQLFLSDVENLFSSISEKIKPYEPKPLEPILWLFIIAITKKLQRFSIRSDLMKEEAEEAVSSHFEIKTSLTVPLTLVPEARALKKRNVIKGDKRELEKALKRLRKFYYLVVAEKQGEAFLIEGPKERRSFPLIIEKISLPKDATFHVFLAYEKESLNCLLDISKQKEIETALKDILYIKVHLVD